MGYDGNIVRRAQSLVKRCGTRDPFEIAEHLGVEILTVGSLKQLKGFYRVIKRNRFIFLNDKNPPQMNRIVCAHELGHDQLHREFAASNTLQEFMLYDMNSIQEYEANVFAANLLAPPAVVDAIAPEKRPRCRAIFGLSRTAWTRRLTTSS